MYVTIWSNVDPSLRFSVRQVDAVVRGTGGYVVLTARKVPGWAPLRSTLRANGL